MIKRNLLAAFLFIVSTLSLQANPLQTDTLKVMTYNTDNYGFPATESCPGLLTENKHIYLRSVVQYEDPDILGLEKMNASPASFSNDTIIDVVLDSICNGCYGHADYTNVSGYYKENMLYYKKSKLGFISTTTIYSNDNNISDINLHKLYYKNPDLSSNHDTTFINIILAHLESGSGSASERATEIAGAKAWLNANINTPGNYIFMGDLNTQSSDESCFQTLISSSDANTQFYDPPNQLGDWADDPSSFADCLTQSTRVTDPGDCSATGGISYRYDHILCTQSIMQGNDSVAYIPGSFQVIGQDGNHTGLALTDAPANTSVPSQILNNLYYMSEHLPVTIQLAITKSLIAGVTASAQPSSLHVVFNHIVNDYLSIKLTDVKTKEKAPDELLIYNEQGQLLCKHALSENETNINTSNFSSGIYFFSIKSKDAVLFNDKFVKVEE